MDKADESALLSLWTLRQVYTSTDICAVSPSGLGWARSTVLSQIHSAPFKHHWLTTPPADISASWLASAELDRNGCGRE